MSTTSFQSPRVPAALPPLTVRGALEMYQALVQRLGATAADELLAYVSERMPLNTETHDRVTANPLMLAMVVSITELRRGRDAAAAGEENHRLVAEGEDAADLRAHAVQRELERRARRRQQRLRQAPSVPKRMRLQLPPPPPRPRTSLLYTSDAADE